MMIVKEPTLTQKEVKERGFTDKLIGELLPEPQLVNNPYYKCAAKMKLWKLSDVENAMNNPIFQESFKKREKCKAAAAKAVATKKAKLKDETDKFIESIQIKKMDIETVRKCAVEAQQCWYNNYKYENDYGCFLNAYDADEDTKNRWTVNYIRHEMTKYDEQLYHMKAKVGIHDMYFEIHNLILDKIALVYPELAQECENQKKARNCMI